MKNIKYLFPLVCMTLSVNAWAKQEVIQIQYNDGLLDYIPVTDVKSISFLDCMDTDVKGLNEVNAMFDAMKAFGSWSDESDQSDFGYPSVMISLDSHTEDFLGEDEGYNWFRGALRYLKPASNDYSGQMWNYMYNLICNAGKIINPANGYTPDASTANGAILLAQAYAMRSFAYWNLIQVYAKNYTVGTEGAGVAILPDDATTIEGTYPLSTVGEVYARIMSDIDRAIELLEQAGISTSLIDIAVAKRYVSTETAYGLRARYNLSMHRYAEAAADAAKAIELSSASPLFYRQAMVPGFANAKAGNWMWGITVEPDDRCTTTGLCNFPAMVSSLSYGYTSGVGMLRYCSLKLWNYLSAHPADARLCWFTDDNGLSDGLTNTQQEAISELWNTYGISHFNVKFGLKKDGVDGLADVPLMRIEEMYLILAEGQAMSGDVQGGLATLTDFVKTYRNPSYDFTAGSAEDLQNEILWQRRAELWGEGLVYFDYLRLQRDIDRLDDAPERAAYRIRGTSDWMQYSIPDVFPKISGYEYETESSLPSLEGWNE